MRISTTRSRSQTKFVGARQSIYDGRDRCGDVQEQDHEFIARDRRGEIIGTFGSLPDAANACWRVAHGQTVDAP
jgi:hypothetical protein